MIIDFHTHTFPEKIAARALAKMSAAGDLRHYADGTASGLLRAERAAGVDRSILLPVATKPEQVHHINDYAAELNRHAFITNQFSFGSMHPDYENWRQELDRLAANRMRGIKIHPVYQQTDFDDIRYLRILERAGELGLIVVAHAGLDLGFPGSLCATPEKARRALQSVGPVRLVLAHMGGWDCWEQVAEKLADTSALFDTAYCLDDVVPLDPGKPPRHLLSLEDFAALVRTFGAQRVLFGTDSPWTDPQDAIRRIRALPLSDEEKTAILGGNAQRLLGI